eukprot:scaffold3710_cov286-Chaetoceros_neogracile.AAC.1
MSGNLERYGLLKKNLNDSLRLQIETHILDTTHIVLTTLGSAGCMALEASANVEVVVVDEAAQSVEPATLRLEETDHEVHLLDTQYRMHPQISKYPRNTFYGGYLKDGANVLNPSYGNPLLERVKMKLPSFHKSNDGLELEVRSCKKEKIAILRGIRGYLNSIRRNEEAKRSREYHNGPLSDNLNEIKENEPISTSHTFDESINSQLTSFESASSIEAPTTSSSTCSSLITDDGCATLRLAKRNGKPSTFPFLRGAIQATTNSCEVEFTSNPGLQFLRLPPNVIVDANMNPHLPVFLI